MRKIDPSESPACSLARTIDVIGEKWTFLILRDLLVGMSRNDEIARDLGIATNILATRLQTLLEHGVIIRETDTNDARAFVYSLSDKGRELFPILLSLTAWGDKWITAPGQQPVLFVHERCGEVTAAVPTCSHCLEPLLLTELSFIAGPGGKVGPRTQRIGHYLKHR